MGDNDDATTTQTQVCDNNDDTKVASMRTWWNFCQFWWRWQDEERRALSVTMKRKRVVLGLEGDWKRRWGIRVSRNNLGKKKKNCKPFLKKLINLPKQEYMPTMGDFQTLMLELTPKSVIKMIKSTWKVNPTSN